MLIDWIGRVFGGQDADHRPGLLLEHAGRANAATALSTVVSSLDQLAAEIDRARRYEHALSVVVMTTGPFVHQNGKQHRQNGTAAHEDQREDQRDATLETHVPQVVALLAARVLRDMLRGSDIVCYRPTENHLVLGLAESDAQGARKTVRRIGELFRSRLRLEVRAGLARFPEDGLTVDDLIMTAAARAAVGLTPPQRIDHP